jgi:hypothetical protein
VDPFHQTQTPPGWYPDPWYPQSMRYWDGLTWTNYAQATGPMVRVDLAQVRAWAERIPIAFWARAAAAAISAVASPLVVGHAVNDARDRTGTTTVGFGFGFGGGGNVGLQLLSLVGLAATIGLMVWGYHITQTARQLGLRTTHSPGWAAAGWLVCIISLWFPYQIVRDALPPGHPARNQVGWWWGLHIGTSVIGVVAGLVAIGSPGSGALVGCLGAACALGAGYFGHELATAIGHAHLRIATLATSGAQL